MKNIGQKGLSLIEFAVVMAICCVVLTYGLNFLRSRAFESKNASTVKQVVTLSQAVKDYIRANDSFLRDKLYQNDSKPIILQINVINDYIYKLKETKEDSSSYSSGYISDEYDKNESVASYSDGYGNSFSLMIGLYNSQIYALLVDNGNKSKIPVDYLNRLKMAIGSDSGGINPDNGEIEGIMKNWSFPKSIWQTADMPLEKSPFVYLVSGLKISNHLFPSLSVMLAQGGNIKSLSVKNEGGVTWTPIFYSDDLSFSFVKNAGAEYVTMKMNVTNGKSSEQRIYNSSVIIHPQSEWVEQGVELHIELYEHNKITGKDSSPFSFVVRVNKENSQTYFNSIFSSVHFSLNKNIWVRTSDGNYNKASGCINPRYLVATRVVSANLEERPDIGYGKLLLPIVFRLAFSPQHVPSMDEPFFFFRIDNTNDEYYDNRQDVQGAIDISSGLCSGNEYMKSTINLAIKNFSSEAFSSVADFQTSWNDGPFKMTFPN